MYAAQQASLNPPILMHARGLRRLEAVPCRERADSAVPAYQ